MSEQRCVKCGKYAGHGRVWKLTMCPQCERGHVDPPSQLDRIEKRQTDDYNSLDARLTQLVLNTSAQLSDIDSRLNGIRLRDQRIEAMVEDLHNKIDILTLMQEPRCLKQ